MQKLHSLPLLFVQKVVVVYRQIYVVEYELCLQTFMVHLYTFLKWHEHFFLVFILQLVQPLLPSPKFIFHLLALHLFPQSLHLGGQSSCLLFLLCYFLLQIYLWLYFLLLLLLFVVIFFLIVLLFLGSNRNILRRSHSLILQLRINRLQY